VPIHGDAVLKSDRTRIRIEGQVEMSVIPDGEFVDFESLGFHNFPDK
jgi:hypothetical protein